MEGVQFRTPCFSTIGNPMVTSCRRVQEGSLGRFWLALAFLACVGCNDTIEGNGNDAGGVDVTGPEVQTDTNAADTKLDVQANACEGQPNGTNCDDSNPCTVEDACEAGVCVGGQNDPCESLNPCVTGSCDPLVGCVFEDVQNGEECIISCFDEAFCVDGTCEHVAASKVICPEPGDDEPCLVSLECEAQTGECTLEIYAQEGSECDTDKNLCSEELCDGEGLCLSTDVIEDCQQDKLVSPCEFWVCQPKTGDCVSVGFAGAVSCSDGSACTFNDTCLETEFGFIVCQGTPVTVDDANPCTDDSCVDGNVLHSPINGLFCDPADGCSEAGICAGGLCEPDKICDCVLDNDCPVPEDKCLGELFCDDGICTPKPGAATLCQESEKPCQAAVCVPETGDCIDQPVEDGVACDDANVCTTPDLCESGVCVPGAGIDCGNGIYCDGQEGCDAAKGCLPGLAPTIDDGVPCTVDSCDEALGQVVHAPDDSACQDPVLCTINLCTEVGCAFQASDEACNNGLYCDGIETCDAETGCVTANVPVVDDGVACTIDSCDEEADKVLHTLDDALCQDAVLCTNNVCTEVGCQFQPDDAQCDNLQFCDGPETCSALDGCQPGSPPAIDDGVACTDDSCDEALDEIVNSLNDGLCDDGHDCTSDACTAAGCENVDVDALCDDGNPCTDDACVGGTCQQTSNLDLCDDGDPCSLASACLDGGCSPTEVMDCGDGDPCTADSCAGGICQYANAPSPCDDGDPCTDGDVCAAGQCYGPKDTPCDDDNDCTDDSCDPAQGCVFTPNAAACDDSDQCTTVDACSAALCVGTGDLDCDDDNGCTDDACDPALGCISSDNDADCDDGDFCTLGDACALAACVGGAAPDCDDGNPCTDDGCDPALGCSTLPNDLLCDDGDDCSFNDQCKGGECLGFRYTDGKVKGSQKIGMGLGGFNGLVKDYDSFGTSAAGIGDLDGDGVEDIVVGAPNDDDGGNGVGAVWILFLKDNGTVKDTQKISALEGGFQGALFSFDGFGTSVAAIGDVDGDGVQEIAVGAPGDDTAALNAGAVWILFMKTDGTVKVEREITTGEAGFSPQLAPGDSFGASIANGGDLDGDGRNELVVGAPLTDGLVVQDLGAIWILNLKGNGIVSGEKKLMTITGTAQASERFGVSVAGLGDVNGNGVPDLAVGAEDGIEDYGAIWILTLNSDGSLDTSAGPGYTKLGQGLNGAPQPKQGIHFGGAVAAMGDLDGDDVPDLTASSYAESNDCIECGTVWTLFLNSDGTVKKKKQLGQGIPQNGFKGPLYGLKPHWGRSVALIGDLNSDGLPDFVAGANEDDVSQGAGCSNCGAVFLVFMDEDPLCVP